MVEVGQDRAALKIVPVVGCAMICTILQWLYTPPKGRKARSAAPRVRRRDGKAGEQPAAIQLPKRRPACGNRSSAFGGLAPPSDQ
jgi:hypothetical protein